MNQATHLYENNDSSLTIDFDSPLEHETIYLQAETVSGKKNVIPIQINVCGYEKIQLTKGKENIQTIVKDSQKLIVDLKSLFSNSEPDCPITEYKLELGTTDSRVAFL